MAQFIRHKEGVHWIDDIISFDRYAENESKTSARLKKITDEKIAKEKRFGEG